MKGVSGNSRMVTYEATELPLNGADFCGRKPDHPGLTRRLAFVILIACFVTWFCLGFGVTALNGPQNNVVNWIRSVKCQRLGGAFGGNISYYSNETEENYLWCKNIPEHADETILSDNPELNRTWAVLSSMLCLGAVVSTLTAVYFVRFIGVKRTVLVSTLIFAAGSFVCALCKVCASPEMLASGRFIIGCGTGLMCVVTPVYLSEITPPKVRGAAGTLPSLMFNIGLIMATVMGLPNVLGSDDTWPYLIGIQMIPGFIACVTLPFCPESPRHLYITKSKSAEARRALQWLRGTFSVEEEMNAMEEEKRISKKSVAYMEFFKDPFLKKLFGLCAVPMLAQQLCGFYCVIFYSTSIFSSLGLDRLQSTGANVGLWFTMLLFGTCSMFLVDRLGRKTLLAVSVGGLIAALLVFVVCRSLSEHGYGSAKYGSAGVLPVYAGSFSLGAASIPWILPGEMFAQEARSTAACLISAVSWGTALLTTLLFPIVVAVAKQYTYLIFVALMAGTLGFILAKLPETKGKSLEDIQEELRND